MLPSIKQRAKKTIVWFAILFVIMWIFRFIYGYQEYYAVVSYDNSGDFFSNVSNLRKNYASEKKFSNMQILSSAPHFEASQKYEKTATVKSKSTAFEKDEATIKSTAKAFSGVIQYEQNTGNKGSRELHLMIGIEPAKFDSFYVSTQHIGAIRSTEITKVDKTTEFRQLNAKKSSLEKTLASLNDLRTKTGAISDYIALHDKILEIESLLQSLGVELGNFDAENEFCTIRFSLYEGAVERSVSILTRIKVALEWTIKYYAVLVLCVFLAVTSSLIFVIIIDKLKLLNILNPDSK